MKYQDRERDLMQPSHRLHQEFVDLSRQPHEQPLAGLVSTVVRIDAEVRRTVRPASPAIHALLQHLERAGFDGAPRFLGIDGHGRERLTFIPGTTFDRSTPQVIPDEVLPAIGRLIRRYHDAVTGFSLPDDLHWHAAPERAVPGDFIVCHNDLSPRNTVFRDGQPLALIDWDMAYEAPAIWDLAHAVWQFGPVLADRDFASSGWPGAPPHDRRLDRMRLLIDGYGLSASGRVGFAAVLALRIDRTATGIRMLAAEGHPVHQKLVADGVVDQIERSRDWTREHAAAIDAALTAFQTPTP